jgi:hypothetical protein
MYETGTEARERVFTSPQCMTGPGGACTYEARRKARETLRQSQKTIDPARYNEMKSTGGALGSQALGSQRQMPTTPSVNGQPPQSASGEFRIVPI